MNDDDEGKFDATAGDTWRWRDFFRICCKRKKQSVHISIGSVHHLTESDWLWRLLGVELRRDSQLLWFNSSLIVGVKGDLREKKPSSNLSDRIDS